MVEYRYELKYEISSFTAQCLKNKLKLVMAMDKNSINQDYSYDIRSLYFDDPYSSALFEKRDGIEFRKKYRIRLYNQNDKLIKLECKHKDQDFTYKQDATITKKMAENMMKGQYSNIQSVNPFINQFLLDCKLKQLKPSVIVDYRRTAFTYPISEVRITFDENICSGRYNLDIFDFTSPTYPLLKDNQAVLEVKCNEYIPEHILAILASEPKLRQAISKFELCRSIK